MRNPLIALALILGLFMLSGLMLWAQAPAPTFGQEFSVPTFSRQLAEAARPGLIDIGAAVLSAAGTIFLTWLAAFLRRRRILDAQETMAFNSIVAAVQETWREYVRDIKANNSHLTAAEKETAAQKALYKARAIASEQGVDLFKVYSSRIVRGLIDRQVEQAKSASDRP